LKRNPETEKSGRSKATNFETEAGVIWEKKSKKKSRKTARRLNPIMRSELESRNRREDKWHTYILESFLGYQMPFGCLDNARKGQKQE